MGLFASMNISASALTAERLRMDVIANNLANVNTTRSTLAADGRWLPYRRQRPLFAARGEGGFWEALRSTTASADGSSAAVLGMMQDGERNPEPAGAGVRVTGIVEDVAPSPVKYDPGHPDANAEGYVTLPNVNTITEMVDMITASRAYEANVTALNAAKAMAARALDIGRG